MLLLLAREIYLSSEQVFFSRRSCFSGVKLRETIWNSILKNRKENEPAEFRDEMTNWVNERTKFFCYCWLNFIRDADKRKNSGVNQQLISFGKECYYALRIFALILKKPRFDCLQI